MSEETTAPVASPSKEIIVGTNIKDNATSIRYKLIQIEKDDFIFKPITALKSLQNEKYSFDEFKNLFINNEINIEGFEHNEADERLVSLIIAQYIKDSLLAEKAQEVNSTNASKEELSLLITQQQETITAHENTISNQAIEIANLEGEQEQNKDIIATHQATISNQGIEIENLKKQIEKQTQEHSTQIEDYKNQIAEFEKTIQGMELMKQD